jgi:hypothetical protein
MLPPGSPCFSVISSTSSGACLGLDCYVGSYIRTVKLIRGIPIMTSILQPSARASSSSSSVTSPDQNSADDYPKIGRSTYENFITEGRLIIMVASAGGPLHNSSSQYPTIKRSEASDDRTLNHGMIQNLNTDFNVIQLQTIMESIQRMAPEGSLLIALPQQGAEVVNFIIAQRSTDNPRGEHFVGNRSNDQVKRAQSEATSSASGNRRLADNYARRWITQNLQL